MPGVLTSNEASPTCPKRSSAAVTATAMSDTTLVAARLTSGTAATGVLATVLATATAAAARREDDPSAAASASASSASRLAIPSSYLAYKRSEGSRTGEADTGPGLRGVEAARGCMPEKPETPLGDGETPLGDGETPLGDGGCRTTSDVKPPGEGYAHAKAGGRTPPTPPGEAGSSTASPPLPPPLLPPIAKCKPTPAPSSMGSPAAGHPALSPALGSGSSLWNVV